MNIYSSPSRKHKETITTCSNDVPVSDIHFKHEKIPYNDVMCESNPCE